MPIKTKTDVAIAPRFSFLKEMRTNNLLKIVNSSIKSIK